MSSIKTAQNTADALSEALAAAGAVNASSEGTAKNGRVGVAFVLSGLTFYAGQATAKLSDNTMDAGQARLSVFLPPSTTIAQVRAIVNAHRIAHGQPGPCV